MNLLQKYYLSKKGIWPSVWGQRVGYSGHPSHFTPKVSFSAHFGRLLEYILKHEEYSLQPAGNTPRLPPSWQLTVLSLLLLIAS